MLTYYVQYNNHDTKAINIANTKYGIWLIEIVIISITLYQQEDKYRDNQVLTTFISVIVI